MSETKSDRFTLEERRALLAAAPLLRGVAEADLHALLPHTALRRRAQGFSLFGQPGATREVFLLVEGGVFLTLRGGRERADEEEDTGDEGGSAGAKPSLLIQALGPGDLVADLELAALICGRAGRERRRAEATVCTAQAAMLHLAQPEFARLVRANPPVQERLAEMLATRLARTQALAESALLLKNQGVVRVARLLLELFDRFGLVGPGGTEFPGAMSVDLIARLLGLTARSVQDDVLALEEFGAIDHIAQGRRTRVTLLDRGRLARIAQGGAADQQSWLAEIDAALAAGDLLRALDLAQMARLADRRSAALLHRAALAALRLGDHDRAGLLLAEKLPAQDMAPGLAEDLAALAPRLLKERAFLAEAPEEARRLALLAAEGYRAVHARTGGIYTGINAASLLRIGGDAEGAAALAAQVLRRVPPGREYWSLAVRAEANALVGDTVACRRALADAAVAPDVNAGAIATTLLQLRRLAAAGAVDAALLDALRPLPVLARLHGAEGRAPEAGISVVEIADAEDIAWAEALGSMRLVLVFRRAVDATLAAIPARLRGEATERMKRLAARAERLHVASAAEGAASRLARGLAAGEAGRLLADCVVLQAQPAAPPAGLAAFVSVEAAEPRLVADLAATVAPGAMRPVPGRAVPLWAAPLDEGTAREAAAFALALASRLPAEGACVFCDLDLARGPAPRLTETRPRGLEGAVLATEAFMAECALLPPPSPALLPVGRVRSLTGGERLPMFRLARP